MSGSLQDVVVVIDAMPFRRARDECFLGPWAKDENVELISLLPTEAHARLVQDINCRMLIYNIGGVSSASHQILAEMQVLRTLCPAGALAILADDDSLECIISAVKAGARAYLSSSMPPELALHALSFVLHGGTYVPPAAIMGGCPGVNPMPNSCGMDAGKEVSSASSPAQPNRISCSAVDLAAGRPQASLPHERSAWVPFGGRGHSATASEGLMQRRSSDAIKTSLRAPVLTDRQRSVLMCLYHGDPNKVIGRKLGMTETTVKVHVREIMRKLGVANRTQVAVVVGKNGFDRSADDLIVGVDAQNGTDSTNPH